MVNVMKFEANLVQTIERTHDVKSFRFPRPSSFEYKAGQFMFVTIQGENNELKKHFTISSSPTETGFIEFTKKLTGNPYSTSLNALQLNDKVKIEAPYGRFTLDEKFKEIAMLSGGIGITPLRSICKYVSDLQLEFNIILIYGNNTIEDIVFKEELDQLQEENSNLKVVYTIVKPLENWHGYSGYIDAQMIEKEIPDYKSRAFYPCGPPAMVKAMTGLLTKLNVPSEQIKIENFSGY